MKWILWIGGSLAALVVLIVGFGASLPKEHVATRRARYKQPSEALFALISGAQDWRPQVKKFEQLPDRDGRRMWKETDARGDVITYEVMESLAHSRYVTRIADPDLPFGGRWVFALKPADGGTEVEITEEGEIYNLIFRALAKLVFGYTSSIEDYLKALGQKVGEQTTPEA
ncbi:MAG: hypothetical protein ABI823_04580 [Bryobacteraceae bacterium]